MTQRAIDNNQRGTGHISSSTSDPSGGTGQSGNMGGGAIPIGSLAVYPDPNSLAYVKNAYSGNATIYTIISHISRKFAFIPRYVYEIDDPQAVRTYKHYLRELDNKKPGYATKMADLFMKAYKAAPPTSGGALALAALLERPNPGEGQDSFFDKAGSYYETNGEAVIWCNRGTDDNDLPAIDGPILEMYVLPPQYMEMVPDPYNVWGSLGWIFNVAGKRIPIDNENIIHWKKTNLNFDGVTREHQRGMSPLRPGNKKLTEDESATDASVAMNQNEGARGIAYDSSSIMNPVKETQIRNQINNKVNNRDMRGAVAFVQGALGYIDLSTSSVDMELETRKDNIFDRLCNLFGVPPDLFKTGQTYQNLIQARKDLITNKILPMASSFRDELNRVLIPAFGLNPNNITTDIDATMIVELQDDMAELVTSLNGAWWLTPNEKRKEMNQPKSDAEGMDDIWIANTLVKMEDAAQQADTLDSFGSVYGQGDGADPGGDTPPGSGKPDPSTDPKPGKNAAGGKNKANS